MAFEQPRQKVQTMRITMNRTVVMCNSDCSGGTMSRMKDTNLTVGICSLIISLVMFIWLLSLGHKETKFLKFIVRPFYLPIIWVLSILYNLFFRITLLCFAE